MYMGLGLKSKLSKQKREDDIGKVNKDDSQF